jgi:hypothetical protein
LKIKVKSCRSDSTEVIEAESQVVLNSLTEHDFRDALKNSRSGGMMHTRRRGYFEGDGSQ